MSEPDDRYLWDASGPPDREVEHLERVLSRYRYDARSDAMPAELRRRPRALRWLALAAAVVAVFVAGWWWTRSVPGYAVHGLAGVERARVGERISTGASESAVFEIGELGDVHLQPDSAVRVEAVGAERHRLFLERGRVRASIFAKPGVFQIGTPAGLSVDLGCVYEVRVDTDGVSRIEVLTGRVAFEGAGKRVVVPAGSACQATRSAGPNVPVRVNASEEFRNVVRRLERDAEPEANDVEVLLACDWRDESATLWHLYRLTRSETLRSVLFAALRKTWPLPNGVAEADAQARDADALDAWEVSVARDWH